MKRNCFKFNHSRPNSSAIQGFNLPGWRTSLIGDTQIICQFNIQKLSGAPESTKAFKVTIFFLVSPQVRVAGKSKREWGVSNWADPLTRVPTPPSEPWLLTLIQDRRFACDQTPYSRNNNLFSCVSLFPLVTGESLPTAWVHPLFAGWDGPFRECLVVLAWA